MTHRLMQSAWFLSLQKRNLLLLGPQQLTDFRPDDDPSPKIHGSCALRLASSFCRVGITTFQLMPHVYYSVVCTRSGKATNRRPDHHPLLSELMAYIPPGAPVPSDGMRRPLDDALSTDARTFRVRDLCRKQRHAVRRTHAGKGMKDVTCTSDCSSQVRD